MAWWLSASSRDGMTIPRSSSTVSSTPTSLPSEISMPRSSSTMRRRGSGSSGGESTTFTTMREGFCSFSSLPLAVPQFTRLRTLRLRDLILPSREELRRCGGFPREGKCHRRGGCGGQIGEGGSEREG
ncbi:hypothetical protein VIGAN_06128900 [Vigna angularis var. angularis]|uniref:Uncharacterized protein n=1 Tax=Vigna angularis var. angularis TaxID=157739 RepID=A0A0S3SB71_PHAAN|nr:hypothetical protein VIGAN_06128900 [Vigna angularis var. angularis]